jgi:hypothetical protein
MSATHAIVKSRERRRSPRMSACIDVIVCEGRGYWQERTCTLSVSAHGVLVALGTKVAIGQWVILRNPENSAEKHGRIAGLGRAYGGRREVAIEFMEPAFGLWPKPALELSAVELPDSAYAELPVQRFSANR